MLDMKIFVCIIKSAMKKHAQKMNREYWGNKMPNCNGVFAIANILLTSEKGRDLRCVLSL